VETLHAYPQEYTFSWEYPEPKYTLEDQLQFILPSHSLPEGISVKYPDELYEEATETRHPWMRRFAWECDPWVSLPWGDLTTVDAYVLPPIGIPHAGQPQKVN